MAMPICQRCGRSAILTYGGVCGRCLKAEEKEDREREERERDNG
jgi:NMD protein affecting ribosome stability and mRNA decay